MPRQRAERKLRCRRVAEEAGAADNIRAVFPAELVHGAVDAALLIEVYIIYEHIYLLHIAGVYELKCAQTEAVQGRGKIMALPHQLKAVFVKLRGHVGRVSQAHAVTLPA